MMHRLLALLALLCLLAACAQQPLSQKIANGYQLADAYLTRTELLYDAGAIDNAAAQTRLDQVKLAKTNLDAASIAWVRCSGQPASTAPAAASACTNAASYAAAAQTLLGQIEMYLRTKEARP